MSKQQNTGDRRMNKWGGRQAGEKSLKQNRKEKKD